MNLIIKAAEKINKFINIFLIKEIYAYYLYVKSYIKLYLIKIFIIK